MTTTLIKGGSVVDGTGAPAVAADVLIEGDRIAAIGAGLEASGADTVEAAGLVVCPGFIDIHTHYDAQVFWDPALTPSSFHGVTTVVAGNCGFSIAPTRSDDRELIARTLENVEDMDPASLAAGIPETFETFPEYLGRVAGARPALNVAAYIGHTALRVFVMGTDAYERPATHDEIAEMAQLVTEAMEAGAAGFATSFAMTHQGVDGKPVPSRFAERDEIDALFAAVGSFGRGVIAVAPGESMNIPDLYEVQPAVGVPFTYGALLTFPGGVWEQLLDLNEKGWDEGAQVWPQVTPRPLGFSMTMADPFTLNTNPVFAALMSGSLEDRRAAYADERWRAEAIAALAEQKALAPRWETFDVVESTSHPDLVGRPLLELAEEAGTSPLEVMIDLALESADLEGIRFRAVLANDDPEGIAVLLQRERCTLGLSDAGAHVGQLCDAPQATDFLGNWVRDRSLMSLEEAIRKLTSVQADLFGFAERGRLVEGAFADVVVFDPATIAPGPLRRVRDFPAEAERLTAPEPEGVHHVFVNGTSIRRDEIPIENARPGRVVSPS